MGNGYTGQTNSAGVQNFFTAGAGTNSVNTNNFEAENNLDLTNSNISWGNPSPERDLRNIGGRVINSHEAVMPGQNETAPSPEFGKIINLEMPPGAKLDNAPKPANQAEIIESSINKSVINTEGRLESAGVKEIDKAISKLNKTGNIADFYDTARDAMEVNLDNSYNRKLAA